MQNSFCLQFNDERCGLSENSCMIENSYNDNICLLAHKILKNGSEISKTICANHNQLEAIRSHQIPMTRVLKQDKAKLIPTNLNIEAAY